jgi:Ca-activated chloride channel family protein
MTLYDHDSKIIRYNFIHTLNAKGTPDSLVLDSKHKYDLVVHSIPEVAKEELSWSRARTTSLLQKYRKEHWK